MDKITDVFGIWGGIIATGLLFWTIYRDVMDKGKLKVHCALMKKINPNQPNNIGNKKLRLVFDITNTGRRPITVVRFGLKVKGVDHFIRSDEIPKKLAPTDFTLQECFSLELLNNDLESLWALDSFGKIYYAEESIVNKIKKEAKEKNLC